MYLVLCFSKVCSWCNFVLNYFQICKLVVYHLKSFAPNSIDALGNHLYTLLRSCQRQIIVYFILPQITVFNDISAEHASLAHSNNIYVAFTKNWMLLYQGAVLFNLDNQVGEQGNVLTFVVVDVETFNVDVFAFVFGRLLNQLNHVLNLTVADVINSVEDNNWVSILPLANNWGRRKRLFVQEQLLIS